VAAQRAWLGLVAIAGWVQAASIAWPLDAGIEGWLTLGQPSGVLQVGSLALLVAALRQAASAGRAFLAGWVFAIAWLAGSFWWLFISMHTYGGLAAPLAALAVLALAAALGLYYALAAALWWRWAARRDGAGSTALAFAGLWTLAEVARGRLFTGFPWGAGGYAHVDGWLSVWAPLVGVYGVGGLAAALAAVLALLMARIWPSRGRMPAAGVSAVGGPEGPPGAKDAGMVGKAALMRAAAPALGSLLALSGGLWLPEPATRSTGALSLVLLQGNIPQDQKFEPGSGVPQALDWYAAQLSRPWPGALVVAPETALPLLPAMLPPGYWDDLRRPYLGADPARAQAALIGVPLGDATAGYTNSAVGWAAGQPEYRYDKHHLVPFGEFVPPLFRWFTDLMRIPLGDFARGGVGQASFEWRGQRLAPNICYEDLFGEELAARFADAARAPTVFVNLSNIAWFGNTVAIDQHLQISRMRALEFARPMVRATNTGATALIDHRGVVVAQALPHARGVLQGEVEGRAGTTGYAAWAGRFGLWPLLLAALLCLVPAALKSGAARRAEG
jgi:apolipoprotein N-acyltransferase